MQKLTYEGAPVLEFGGALFIRNEKDKKTAAEIAMLIGGIFRKYGVNITKFDPTTMKVEKWNAMDDKNGLYGFSVWKPVPKEEAGNFSGRRLRG